MDKEKNQDLAPIDLGAITRKTLLFLRRFWAIVLVLAIIGGGLMYFRAVRSYSPRYKSEAMFTVSVNYSGSTDLDDYSYYYDKSAAKLVTETFPYLLQSEKMRELVCQKLGTSYINGSISAASSANTNLFTLTVTSSNAQDAYDILCAVIDVYPSVSRMVIGETQLIMTREPALATAPYNSLSWHRSVITGAAAGAILGLALLVVLAALRKTVMNSDDVKKIVNLACLARVPDIKNKQRVKSDSNNLLISRQEPDSAFCESFRLLRLKLLRSLKEGEQVILVTSTVPSEGKSSVAVNTALALAKDNKKVLLVDADLRGPSVKKLLNLRKESTGMGDYLSDKGSIFRFLRYEDTNLRVFAGDEAISNPTPLLRQDRLKSMLDSLRPKFDYIIIDTPPCSYMADAAALCPSADKVVYVIREDFASTNQIFEGVQSLSSQGADICGFVFNRSSSTRSGRYGYGYGYGHGYGYGYGYGKRQDGK